MRKEERPGEQDQPSCADTPRAWKKTQLGYKDLDKTDQLGVMNKRQPLRRTRTEASDQQLIAGDTCAKRYLTPNGTAIATTPDFVDKMYYRTNAKSLTRPPQ